MNEINWNEKLDHLNDVDEMCEQFTKCLGMYPDKNNNYSE